MPVRMTSRIVGGSSNAGPAWRMVRAASRKDGSASPRGRFMRLAISAITAISETAMRSPGTTPPRKSAPTETLARLP